jgi:transcriptional regulator with XRE-family HTH domain
LRVERKTQRLTLRDVAGRVGLSFQELSAIERGKVNTPTETLNRIAVALGLAVEVVQSNVAAQTVTPHICATIRDTEQKVSEALHLVQTLAKALCPSA